MRAGGKSQASNTTVGSMDHRLHRGRSMEDRIEQQLEGGMRLSAHLGSKAEKNGSPLTHGHLQHRGAVLDKPLAQNPSAEQRVFARILGHDFYVLRSGRFLHFLASALPSANPAELVRGTVDEERHPLALHTPGEGMPVIDLYAQQRPRTVELRRAR